MSFPPVLHCGLIIAQSLYNRIQKGIAQPQPVSRQRLVSVVARVRCVLFLVDVRQRLCFCGCFAWFQVQSDVPENVKAFARALDDAELEGQILRTEKGSFKLATGLGNLGRKAVLRAGLLQRDCRHHVEEKTS